MACLCNKKQVKKLEPCSDKQVKNRRDRYRNRRTNRCCMETTLRKSSGC
ncbi:hypothetical protein [Bacillus sp. RAR_GA_16]|nr:hypothetical protein [Bacillus sp. RAR_GA_16]MCA0174526.1 hypothetical protein [Bacillus sp. RAR_GA_16]